MEQIISTIGQIAKIDKLPARVSLSAVPNYMQVSSKNTEEAKIEPIIIEIGDVDWQLGEQDLPKLMLTITSLHDKTAHKFYGTTTANQVNASTFFINKGQTHITTENLKSCLMKNNFISSNFELNVSFNTNKLYIKPMGVGEGYGFTLKSEEVKFIASPEQTFTFPSQDTIDNGKNDAYIELDVYSNSPVKLGETYDRNNIQHQGKYMTTIQKAYFKQPLWFNLNATFGNSTSYSIDVLKKQNTGWQDAGSAKNFYFMGYKNDGVNKQPFCYSDIFYVINGYGRNLENNEMEKYVYADQLSEMIYPLTHQPTLTHVKEQIHFFNFLASKAGQEDLTLTLIYKLYTQSGTYIDSIMGNQLPKKDFKTVNTIKLDIDQAMKAANNVGIVKVCLSDGNKEVSHPLTYRILPYSLHKVRDFAFLNALGGWSSFGFADNLETNFSTSNETIFKTQTPDFNISSQIESVYSIESKEKFTIQTMPIRPEVAEWLREMSTSQAVYELDSERYIIVDEMKIKYNTGDDLVLVEMKYRYSDAYNGRI